MIIVGKMENTRLSFIDGASKYIVTIPAWDFTNPKQLPEHWTGVVSAGLLGMRKSIKKKGGERRKPCFSGRHLIELKAS